MNRIVYTRPDGGISIMVPAPAAQLADESDDAFVARIQAKDLPPDAINPRVVEDAEIPADRYFRNAWGNDLKVDMPKARNIHMGRIRSVRNQELAKLDIETMKGRDVQVEKQKLRDIPQTFSLTGATTPDALKALWPVLLPR